MDKLWIVFLFLGVFLLINNFAKRFLIKAMASKNTESPVFVSSEDETDPKVFWEKEKRLVAYHEAGHAVIGLKLARANDVQKVTIIPRGAAGGYNMMVPSEEKLCSTKSR